MVALKPLLALDAEPGSSRVLEVTGAFDLPRALGTYRVGRSDPSVRLLPDAAWRATRTPNGPATIRLMQRRRGPDISEVFASAWGHGAGWALDHVDELIGLHDVPDDFDPPAGLVRDLFRRQPGLRIGRSRAIVEMLVPTILEQKVTTTEAHRSYRALMRAHGETAPGPAVPGGLWLRPDPARLAQLGYADYHRFGIERRRAETIRRVCGRAAAIDRLAIEWVDTPTTEARQAIETIPGLGPWSSAIVAQRAFGDPDAVIVGDYHLPNIVAFNLAGEARATDDRMLELLEPYRGHRGRVVLLLTAGGSDAPRRGPGRRLRDIRRI